MPLLRRRIAAALAAAALSLTGFLPLQAQPSPTVAAASDLKFAIEKVAARFEQETGHKLRLVFGSSGNFKTQILQGAPFHLFMSADEGFVYELAGAGKTEDRGRMYAVGRIGIMVPPGSPLKPDGELKDLAAALKEGRLQKFAIANPEHAPYGARAKEALQRAGLWDAIQPKLVFGENISQTAQFVESGNAQIGIVALSLAISPQLADQGGYWLIPDTLHAPLEQGFMITQRAAGNALARAFAEYMSDPATRAIMVRYGFVLPAN